MLPRPSSVGWGEDPAIDLPVVVEELGAPEPEVDLGRGRLGAVGGMDQVLGRLEGEVAPDRAGCGLVRSGRAVHRPDDGDGVRTLEDGRKLRVSRRGGAGLDTLNIGLGSGRTLTHLSRFALGSIDSVELSEGIIDVNRKILSPWLFSDPRIHHIRADGRNHLLVASKPYDLIVSSPSWAVEQASAGMLTDEFFALARNNLSPRGTIAVWVDFFLMTHDDLNTVARTFARNFEHCTAWYVEGDFIVLVGSKAPFPLSPEQTLQAIDRFDPNLQGKFSIAMTEEMFQSIPPGPVNTDDKPVIEFANARNLITWRSSGS